MSRTLTLIKHARPEKLEGVDSHSWPLSAQGRADVSRLAAHLTAKVAASAGAGAGDTTTDGTHYRAVVSSDEPKAKETAELLAAALGLPCSVNPGLREHDRTQVPLLRTADFVSAIANFFNRPTQLVLGNETARQALKRFEKAVDEVLAAHPDGDLLVVSHGTVIALWLEAYTAAADTGPMDGYQTWRQMGLPSYVSLAWPDCNVTDRMDALPTP